MVKDILREYFGVTAWDWIIPVVIAVLCTLVLVIYCKYFYKEN